MPKKAVVLTVVMVAGVAVVIAYGILSGEPESQSEDVTQHEPTTPEQQRALEKRGPRPEKTRLPEGVKQVEDSDQALAMAKEALERVDGELARASDDETRARLERKKELIVRSIQRLTEQ